MSPYRPLMASSRARTMARALSRVSSIFGRRIGIGDDARAGLDVGLPALEQDAADGDAEVQVAREVEVAHRAGVEAAPRGLELVDDLHGAHLRRARHGARGEARHQRVEPIAVLGQLALDHRHQVHHVRVALERHERRDPHGAVVAHAADVVAAQVHEHHVLGLLLLVALQLLGEPHVLFVRLAARPRARDRMRHGVPALDPHQHLRRRPDDRAVAHAQKNMYGDGFTWRSAR